MHCEGYRGRKIFWGILILIFGYLWYLNKTGGIELEPFWPIIVMLFGLVLIVKGFIFRPVKKGKR